jgi:peroxiredoxin (alkyl hydroperoxide reductase subunit C)
MFPLPIPQWPGIENAQETRMSITAESRIPRILEKAPEFEAKSTHGVIKLSTYLEQGKYVLLFSHPSDFTRQADWDRLNVQLVGVSIDSVFSHIAWVRDIEQMSGVKVKFPVIADLDFKVASAYGLVHEAVSDTAAVRAVFAIDPKGVVRAIIYYPPQLGRSVDELVRIFEAIQTQDKNGVSCGANWQPGDDVIVPSPATVADAEKRMNGGGAGLQVESWYLSKKKL